MSTRRTILGGVMAAALTLSACSGSEPAPDEPVAQPAADQVEQPPQTYEHYVALGDSYAAMGSRDLPQPGSPEFCMRSTDNYVSQVQADSRIDDGSDVSCQGAVTADILSPRSTPDGELPPQVEAITPDTDLVTLSIGGNDLGFADIARCVNTNLGGAADSNCDGELSSLIEQRLGALPAHLDQIYKEIRAQHGGDDLTIVATGYLPTITGHDSCEALAGVSTQDRFWIAALTFAVNLSVRVAAENNGATYVNVEEFADHTLCAEPEQRFIDLTGEETGSYPLHPTPLGQEAMAQAVLGAI